MKKKILIAVVLTAIVAACGFYLLFANAGIFVASITQKTLEQILQVDVEIKRVQLDLTEGRITVEGLTIGNPPGYKTKHALSFGSILVQANIPSFSSDQPLINRIELGETDIIVELQGSTNNLSALIANAAQYSSQQESPQTAAEDAPADKSYKIERLLLRKSTIRVALPLSGGKAIPVPVPEFEILDLGSAEKAEGKSGVKPAEALQIVLAHILLALSEFGGNILPAEVLGNLTASLAKLPGAIKAVLGNTLATAGHAANTAIQATGGAANATLGAAGTAAKTGANAAGGAVNKTVGTVKNLGGLLGNKEDAATSE